MPDLGWFDPEIKAEEWLDREFRVEAWFDPELVEVSGATNATATPATVVATAAVPAPTVAASAVAKAQGQGVAPNTLSGLIGWWDFGNASTLFEDAARTDAAEADDILLGVTDLSGIGNHLSGTGTAAPQYKTGIQNGRSIARFDGSDDNLVSSDTTTISAWTMLVVCRPSSSTVDGYVAHFGSNASGSRFALITGFVDGRVEWFDQSGSRAQIGDTDLTNFHVYAVKHPTTGGTVETFVDQLAGGTFTAPAPGSTPTRCIRVGRAFTANPWPGDIGEVVAFDRVLTDTELADVGRYLAAKWALLPQAAATTVYAVASVPSPTLASHQVVTPATVAAVASVPAPSVLVGGNVAASPATVVATATVPAPTVLATAIVAPSTVVATAAVPAPSARGAAIATPATVVGVAAIPAPTVRGTAIVSPATVVAVAQVPAPTVLAEGPVIVTPATVVAVAAVPAPTTLATARTTPATVVAVAAVPAPTVRGTAITQPATVVAFVAVPAPSILATASVLVSPVTVIARVVIPAPGVEAVGLPTRRVPRWAKQRNFYGYSMGRL